LKEAKQRKQRPNAPASGAPGRTLGEPTQITGTGTGAMASPPQQAPQNQHAQGTSRTTDDHGRATNSSGAISKSIRRLRKEHPRMSGRTVLAFDKLKVSLMYRRLDKHTSKRTHLNVSSPFRPIRTRPMTRTTRTIMRQTRKRMIMRSISMTGYYPN